MPATTSRVPRGFTRPGQRSLDALLTVVVALAIGLPAIATHDGFTYDFGNHLWAVWVQSQAIAGDGVPTYFLNTTVGGVFDPFYMFYGGTLYALTGAVSAFLGGSARIAYVGVIVLSIAAAYGGVLWFARQFGARSWMAHAPALTYVASAYYVTNIYGRGAWPEFVAVSALALLIAAGAWIARAPRLRALPCVLFVGAAVIASGSHTITLVWGSIVIAATLLALRLLLKQPLAPTRRVGLLLGLLTLAVCVNAWFLLPNLVNASDTQIASTADFSWSLSREFNSPRALFEPLRYVPSSSSSPALFVQVPMWLLMWALAAMFVLRARLETPLRRCAAAYAIVLAGLLALIMVGPLWDVVPEPLRVIQLPYRLNTYVAMSVAGLVLVAVLAVQRAEPRERRLLGRGLAAAMTVSVALCVWQLWIPETHYKLTYDDVRDALVSRSIAPRTWYSNNAYHDTRAPIVAASSRRWLVIDPKTVSGNSATLSVTPPPGREPFLINLGAGPGVVRISGVELLGRHKEGVVVARRPAAGSGPLTLTVKTTATARTGVVVTLLAILALIGAAIGAAVRSRRVTPDPAAA